ncbi:MAG: DUF6689 family protein [Solirubrobacterales bacterium]
MFSAPASAHAQTPIDLTITGNQARGTISLPGDICADLTIAFENPVGLTPTALVATAEFVSPTDPDLALRLPADTSIQPAFPVLLKIGPASPSGLTFSSVATVSLHTHNLVYNTAAPQALLKAHDGGSFVDITTSEGIGSYRVGGSGGDFSEFLIVRDSRAIDTAIVDKFEALEATLMAHRAEMPFLVGATLRVQLSAARLLYLAGSLLPAINKLTSFASYVVAHTGADIAGVWDGDNPAQINVAGLLRAGAETLKFSLDRKASQ